MRNQNVMTLNKKMYLKECLTEGARNYDHFLVGKDFWIICEDGTESTVRFFKKDYIHLAGVQSNLSDGSFFEQCKKDKLTDGNILTHQHYNWLTLKGKGVRIRNIHKIVYADVKESLFIFNLHTNTADFPVAIRNRTTNTCVGYVDRIHKARTLRKFTNSGNSDSEKKIAAIFAKKPSQAKYNELVYISNINKVYETNHTFIDKLSDLVRGRLICIINDNV